MKKLLFTLVACFVALAANAGTIYLVGSGTVDGKSLPGGPSGNCLAITSDNNVYTFKVNNIGWLKISDTNASDWATFNKNGFTIDGKSDYALSASDLGKTFTLWYSNGTSEGTNNINPPSSAEYIYTLTVGNKGTNQSRLVVTAATDEKITYEIYLRGSFNNYGVDTNYKFTAIDDNNYELEGITLSQGTKFKIADANWGAMNFGYAGSVNANTEYTLVYNANDITLNQDIKNATFKFNIDTKKMFIDDPSALPDVPIKPDYSAYYVHVGGTFNNRDFYNNASQPVDGIAIFTNLAIGQSDFKIHVWNGSEDIYYVYDNQEPYVPTDQWAQFAVDGYDIYDYIKDAPANGVYTVKYNVENNQIYIEQTGGDTPGQGGGDEDPDPDPDGETEPFDTQFVFSTFEGMQACYPNLPDSSNWTADGSNFYLAVTSLTQDGITIEGDKGTATTATGIPKFYQTSSGVYTFRLTNGNTFTVTAPKGGKLTSIQLLCGSVTTASNAQKITANTGELVVNGSNTKQMDWTAPEGGVESVTFYPTASVMAYNGITVNATKPVATEEPTPEIPETDFEVMGSYNDDSSWQTPIKFTAYENGVYSTAKIEKLVEFKLVENGTWYGKETAGYAVLGEPFTMKAGDEYGNAAFGLSGYVQDAVISFNPTTMEVTVTGTWVDTALKLYIRGDMNNWGNDGLTEADALTTTDGNVYTITLPSLDSGVEFKIASENWSPEFTTNNTGMTNGVYNIINGNNMALGVSMTNVTLTLDINAKKLTVSGTESGFTDLYLLGTMNDWKAATDWKFATEDGENYTLANVNIPADATFKVSNASWTDSFTYTYTDGPIVPNTEYTLENKLEDNTNMWLETAIVNGTVTYNINTHAFKIAMAVEVPDVVKGDITTSASGDETATITDGENGEDGTISAATETGSLTLTVNVPDGYTLYYKDVPMTRATAPAGYTEAVDGKVTISGQGTLSLVYVDNATSTEGTASVYNYTVTKNNASGVEGIEADEADAEYFNLQGVKVANPEKGIYVRVLNGKAVKVVK